MTPRLLGSRRYYTTPEVAELLGISRLAVTRRCQRGRYRVRPGRRPGEWYEILASDIDAEAGTCGGR